MKKEITKGKWNVEMFSNWVDQYGTGDSVNIQTYGICTAIPNSDTRNYSPGVRETGVKIANGITSMPNAILMASAPDMKRELQNQLNDMKLLLETVLAGKEVSDTFVQDRINSLEKILAE